jgi:hypothetical protein
MKRLLAITTLGLSVVFSTIAFAQSAYNQARSSAQSQHNANNNYNGNNHGTNDSYH